MRGVLWLLLVPSPLLAQTRPLLTEEAATARAGTLFLELGADFIRNEPNFLTGQGRGRWDVPVLRLVYSPGDDMEVDLEWTGRVMARKDPDFGDSSDYGDVTLRAKVRFAPEGPRRPGVSARFGVTLPETSSLEGLGPNTLRMSAQVLVSKSLAGVAVHANAGLAVQDEPLSPHAQSDFLAYGLAVVRPVGRGLALAAEVAGLGVGKGSPGADRHAEARAGLRFTTGRARWDAAVRRGFGAADGDWGATAGVAWSRRRGG